MGVACISDMVSGRLNMEEELRAKHRTERKNLRAKIQAMKKGISKGDKKQKKEVMAEIAALEEELEARHKEDLANLGLSRAMADSGADGREDVGRNEDGEGDEVNGSISVGVGKDCQDTEVTGDSLGDSGVKEETTKKSRAQKRKAKKAQQERERAERMAEAEETELRLPNVRREEKDKLSAILTPLGLAVRDISPDGHCLYAAVCDQLSVKVNIKLSVLELRKVCSEYILSNSSEFLPYLALSETGTQDLERYCHDIVETAAWGGQPEIRALSHIYKVPINIYQASAPVVCVGEEYKDQDPLNLSYHLHEYGLGEHYNSVVPI